MAVNRYDDTRAWYAISTYSGYEQRKSKSKSRMASAVLPTKRFFKAMF